MAGFIESSEKRNNEYGGKCRIGMMHYLKEKLKIQRNYFQSKKLVCNNKYDHGLNPEKKYAFIFFAADYNNLGDLAIIVGQKKFLMSLIGEEYTVIKINEADTYNWIGEIKKLPSENVLITLIGGGNSGSLYDFIEIPRRFILKHFKNYRIISFPQTIFFDDSEQALAVKTEFFKVANKCKNLTLVAREKNSDKIYADNTKARILLTPDIVFSYEKYVKPRGSRQANSVAFVLRDDKEKALDVEFQRDLIESVEKRFDKVEYMDTCDVEYKEDNAQKLLDDYLMRLQSISLVITDRLHGMILSYIAKTPCIVFDNNNQKIKSTYNTWLQGQNIVRLFNSGGVEELNQLIDDMMNQSKYMSVNLDEKFDPLRKVVKGEL